MRVSRGPLILRDRYGFGYHLEHGDPRTRLFGTLRPLRELTDDPKVLRYMETTLRSGCTVLDIGASVGVLTLFAARIVGTGGRVVAIEAEAENHAELRRNLSLNQFPGVEVHRLAVTDYIGTATLHVFPSAKRGWHGLGRTEGSGFAAVDTQQVPCITLDEFLEREDLRQIDLMKIDIEGAEPEAFSGAQKTLRAGLIKRIVFELSIEPLRGMNHEIDDVVRPLVEAGYSLWAIDRAGVLTPAGREALGRVYLGNFVALAPGVTP